MSYSRASDPTFPALTARAFRISTIRRSCSPRSTSVISRLARRRPTSTKRTRAIILLGGNASSPLEDCSVEDRPSTSSFVLAYLSRGIVRRRSMDIDSDFVSQMYTRGSASDYDDFKQPGWDFKDILPLARKVRHHHDSIRYRF